MPLDTLSLAPADRISVSPSTSASRLRVSVWLGIIVAVALLLRSLALLDALHRSSDPWIDPDGYRVRALMLFAPSGEWRLEQNAFMSGPRVKAPLYPFVLSLWAVHREWFPLSAALMQIVLGTAAVAGLYVIGYHIHSARAGLIAAAVYAVWLPVLTSVRFFLQEQLHIPLVIIGLALLVRAAVLPNGVRRFALAGGVLGLGALVRSMPLYYIVPAGVIYVALAADRRAATRQMTALFLGFVVVVLPWCVYISAKTGQFVPIDNMGAAGLSMNYRGLRPGMPPSSQPGIRPRPATIIESVQMVWRAMARAPAKYFSDRVTDFRRLFRPIGGQWLESQPPTASEVGAYGLAGVAHASDILFALAAVLAPLGVVLAQRRREALLVALWFGLHLGLLVIFAWNGVRYRSPYEPVMIVLAAIVVAGGWRRASRLALGLSLALSLVFGAAVAASALETARARVPYGFEQWTSTGPTWRTSIFGNAGFSVFTQEGFVNVRLLTPSSLPSDAPIRVRVFLDGREVDGVKLDTPQRQIKYVWRRPLAYVELQATSEDGEPAALFVETLPRQLLQQ